jgi:putative methyltransferase (TIGR04325 family)
VKIKAIFKIILPNQIIRFITGWFYGWHGNFSTWEEAKKVSSGYDSQLILDKVLTSTLKVRDGLAKYERDSVLYNDNNYSFPVITGLLWIALQKNNKINILDFGGALGSTYFQNKKFIDSIEVVNWCIVEQPNYVNAGLQNLQTERLHFFPSIDDCLNRYAIDIVLFSSVLQYLENPFELLEYFSLRQTEFIIIDRTPFLEGDNRITVQKVHPSIYKSTYPCWFFNKKRFLSYLESNYKMILEYDALDKANIKSEFKGFLFQRK